MRLLGTLVIMIGLMVPKDLWSSNNKSPSWSSQNPFPDYTNQIVQKAGNLVKTSFDSLKAGDFNQTEWKRWSENGDIYSACKEAFTDATIKEYANNLLKGLKEAGPLYQKIAGGVALNNAQQTTLTRAHDRIKNAFPRTIKCSDSCMEQWSLGKSIETAFYTFSRIAQGKMDTLPQSGRSVKDDVKRLTAAMNSYKGNLFTGSADNKNLFLFPLSHTAEEQFDKYLKQLESFIGASVGTLARDHEKQRAQDLRFITATYRDIVKQLRIVYAKLDRHSQQKNKTITLGNDTVRANTDKVLINSVLTKLRDTLAPKVATVEDIIKRSTANTQNSGVCLTEACRLRYQLMVHVATTLAAVIDQTIQSIDKLLAAETLQ